MSKSAIKSTVIDEAYMEQFSNDQLAYMTWDKSDFALSVYLDDEESKCEDCVHDARFELITAVLASRVLARRLIGIEPKAIRDQAYKQLIQKESFPAWGTLQ